MKFVYSAVSAIFLRSQGQEVKRLAFRQRDAKISLPLAVE